MKKNVASEFQTLAAKTVKARAAIMSAGAVESEGTTMRRANQSFLGTCRISIHCYSQRTSDRLGKSFQSDCIFGMLCFANDMSRGVGDRATGAHVSE